MDETKSEEYLTRTNLLLGLTDGAADEILTLLIEDAVNLILGFCRIKFLPRPLESLVPMIAADMYRETAAGKSDVRSDVTQVTQGNRSESYAVTRSDAGGVFSRYEKRLMPYRRARVPSDVTEEFYGADESV